jgi:hypothetical protein
MRTTLITGLGAIIIVSLLNTWKFMSKTDEFLGEKATLLAPLLLIAFAFTAKCSPIVWCRMARRRLAGALASVFWAC